MLEEFLKKFYKENHFVKAIIFTAFFIASKLFFVYDFDFVNLFVNEFLIIHAAYFWLNWLVSNIKLSKKNILPLFNVSLIVTAVLLILEVVIMLIAPDKGGLRLGFFQRFSMLVISTSVFGLAIYAFAILVKFFFYRQKGDPKGYYRAMLILLLIAGFSGALKPYLIKTFDLESLFPSVFSWFDNFDTVVEVALILLIVFNSFRVSWIGRLTKKEKVGLIFRSLALGALFTGALVVLENVPAVKKTIYLYSPFVFTASTAMLFYGTMNAGIIFFTTIFHLPTAEESDKKNEELSMLWSFGKLLNQIFDIHELGESILSLARQAGNAEKVWLEISSSEERIFLSEKIEKDAAREITDVLKKRAKTGETRVINLTENPDVSFLAAYDIERILSVPFKVKGETKGRLFLARSFEEEGFDDDEIDAVAGLADYASLAIAKAELLKASIEKERMEKELEVAREIQRKIIPRKLPQTETFEIAAEFMPAFEVGGDYYDFFTLKNKTAFVIADVSGKGIEASYVMAEMKGIFEALSVTEESVDKLIIKANGILSKRLERKNFVTAIVGILEDDAITYYRIGHNKPLFYSEGKAELIESGGIAFGLASNAVFGKNLEAKKIRLREGETLVFYTDGVNEAMNERSEEFGYERFKKTVIENADKSAHDLALAILKKVSVFANKNIQNDDITLLVFRKK